VSCVLMGMAACAYGAPFAASLGRMKQLNVKGLKRYTQAEVLQVAGLVQGQNVTEDDLKEATNVLARTGAFSNLSYSYSTLAGTVTVTLELEETDQILSVRLDNFVWWTDDELRTKLRARVPLFRDKIPVAGSLPDTVADALQALMSERQLPGHVTYTRFGEEGHALEAFMFRVEDISARIRTVDFPGAGPEELPLLQAAAEKDLVGKQYSAFQVAHVADTDFRDVYQRKGYLQVEFAPATASAPLSPVRESASDPDSSDTENPNVVRVDVHIPVHPGLQYRQGAVHFTGNHIVTSEALQKVVSVTEGGPANAPQLKEDLQKIKQLYGTRGYLAVRENLDAHLDQQGKIANFEVLVVEGDVYRFSELTIEGVDDKTATRLRERWSLRPGEPFDTSYEMKFLRETQSLLPQGRWSAADTHLDEAQKTVDVVLRYTPTSIN
jgi:outer membrane protein insertion porin family